MTTPSFTDGDKPLKLPDPDGMNRQRIAWASETVQHFMHICPCDLQDAVADLLCDLMHYSAETGLDFAHELRRAESYFEEETYDDGGAQ